MAWILGVQDSAQRSRVRRVQNARKRSRRARGVTSASRTSSKIARDFLDALVAFGMLERENGTYRNSAETDFFLDPQKYISGFLEMLNARLYGFWGSLTEALRTGENQ